MMDCLEATRAVRINLFLTAFLKQHGICTSSGLGKFQDTHTYKNGQSEKGHLPAFMSNEVKQWDYRYQERKEEAPEERHICGEPQC